jgi:hypothetical protein
MEAIGGDGQKLKQNAGKKPEAPEGRMSQKDRRRGIFSPAGRLRRVPA